MRIPIAFLLAVALLFQNSAADAQQRPGGPQATTELTGQVLDAETNRPVESATVSVWTVFEDASLVTGTVTDAEGYFHLEQLRPGRYEVRISYVGYASHVEENVEIQSGQELDFGTILLEPDQAALDEIEVVAEREEIQFGVDRTIFNVSNQPMVAGGSATDVLQNVPSVEVDIDGNVSLRGSQNVAIHIDGRPAPMSGEFLTNFLQQLSAEMIDRIEVIPNPSARYEPDGMAGILNIVLKDDAELGLNGGLTVSADTRSNYNVSGNLGLQRGPLTLHGSYGFRVNTNTNTGFNFREQRYHTPATYMEQNSLGLNESLSHMLNLRTSYQLTPRDELSAQGTLNTRGGDSEGTNVYAALDPDRTLSHQYERVREAESGGFNSSLRLGYRRTIERSEHELSADARFSHNRNDNLNYFLQQDLNPEGSPSDPNPERQLNDMDSGTTQFEARVDYERPLGEDWKLETGYRGSFRHIINDFLSQTYSYTESAYLTDASLTNAFNFDEQIHAAYGQLARSLGSFDLQAGLRVEQAITTFNLTTTGESFDNNYFSFFPSANAVYRLTDQHRVRASYSKRVRRPRTRQLNPFTSQDDPLHIFVGNPYLQPEYTHSFEAGYQQFGNWGSASVTPFFRRTVNAARRIRTVDDDGVARTTFENLSTANSYGLETSFSFRLGQRFNANAGFNAHQLVTDGSNMQEDLGSSSLVWSARGGATVRLNSGLSLQFFGMYRAPTSVEQGRVSSFAMTNIALRQQLLNNQASLDLRISDPFDTMNFGFETDTEQLFQSSQRYRDSRSVRLSFTYNFGQMQRDRQRGDRDDMDEMDMDDIGIE